MPLANRLHLLACVVLLLLGQATRSALGHGWLHSPASRNWLLYKANQGFYDPMSGNGLGPAGRTQSSYPPGVCGDPFQDVATTSFNTRVTNPIPASSIFVSGCTINITVYLSANHGGRFAFKLCNRATDLTRACFEENYLTRTDNGNRYYYLQAFGVPGPDFGGAQMYNVQYRLPAGFACDNGCTLQWEYITFNSCMYPCDASVCGTDYARGVNPLWGSNPLPICTPTGTPGNPEIFYNCADVRILSSGACNATQTPLKSPPPPVPSSKPPPPVPSSKPPPPVASSSPPPPSGSSTHPPPPTMASSPPPGTMRIAAPGEQCGNGVRCAAGMCCSQYNWCGSTASYCTSGCQPLYGDCWSSTNVSSTSPPPSPSPPKPSPSPPRPSPSPPKPSPSPSSSSTPKPPPPGLQTASPGGACGSGIAKCPTGQCCSQWGWCGTTDGHCKAGCQSSYGTCL